MKPTIDPEEVRRALIMTDGTESVWVCCLRSVAREWLRMQEQGAPHDWFRPDIESLRDVDCCRVCGVVRRADGLNKPCRGPVRVELRDEQPAPDVQAQDRRKCNCPGDYAQYVGDDPHNRWCPRSRNPHPEVIKAQIDAAVAKEREEIIEDFAMQIVEDIVPGWVSIPAVEWEAIRARSAKGV